MRRPSSQALRLLLPPTRAVILRIGAKVIAKRMTARITVAGGRRDYDVEGTATERPPADSPRLER